MKTFIKSGLLILILLGASNGWSYPLDGYPATGIQRLEGFRLAQQGKVKGIRVPPGALLGLDQVDLRLRGQSSFQIPVSDPDLSGKVIDLLGDDADNYGIALLDLTDSGAPRTIAPIPAASANWWWRWGYFRHWPIYIRTTSSSV